MTLKKRRLNIADELLAKPKDYAISAKADYWNGAHDGIIAGEKLGRERMMKDGLDAVKSGQSDKIEKTIAGVFVKYGMDRQKKQMMQGVLNGWLDEDNEPPYDLNVICEEKIPFGKFKHGDKVKLIIIKEE